jgi:hypothetical protein
MKLAADSEGVHHPWGFNQQELSKINKSWDVTPYILVDSYKCFGGIYCFYLYKMEAAGSSQMFGTYLPIRRRHISEDRYIHSHCSENLKSQSMGSRWHPYARLGAQKMLNSFRHSINYSSWLKPFPVGPSRDFSLLCGLIYDTVSIWDYTLGAWWIINWKGFERKQPWRKLSIIQAFTLKKKEKTLGTIVIASARDSKRVPPEYKVVQIWPGLVRLVYTQISPGHIWITL